MAKTSLTAEDWIKGGFRALTTAGPQAIRVEPIARDMQVSKGSFYWHFKDVSALKVAMLDYWEAKATGEIIAAAEHIKGSAREKLDALISQTGHTPEDVGGAGAEPAVLDWARYDPLAGRSVAKVTEKRLAYLKTLFADAGPLADQHAILFYATYLGLSQLDADRVIILSALRDRLLP